MYFDHRHTKTREEALDVAHKVGYLVNIELLRGAKRSQQDRVLAESMGSACKRGVLGQVSYCVAGAGSQLFRIWVSVPWGS